MSVWQAACAWASSVLQSNPMVIRCYQCPHTYQSMQGFHISYGMRCPYTVDDRGADDYEMERNGTESLCEEGTYKRHRGPQLSRMAALGIGMAALGEKHALQRATNDAVGCPSCCFIISTAGPLASAELAALPTQAAGGALLIH
eukprot:scaffold149995_cov19-Prasinocladus_malaysianus.AAC.1